MTLETWIEEFYPESALELARLGDDLAATKHALRKWVGLRSANLERHRVAKKSNTIRDLGDYTEYLRITTDTCALCQLYFEIGGENCPNCPLRWTLGLRCDKDPATGSAPYTAWLQEGDPEPMIQALEQTIRNLEEGDI